MKYIYVISALFLFTQVTFAQVEGVVASAAKPVMRGQAAKKPVNDDLMMPKVVKMQTVSGTFAVDAWKEKGVKFRNDWDETMVYTFQANINDSWSYGETSSTGPGGREENYYALPYGNYVGALVALKTNGKYKVMDASGTLKFSLQPGETVYFLMNDRRGTYSDNSGNVYIRWACESKYQVQMDRLVQQEIESEIVSEIQAQVAPQINPELEFIDAAGMLLPNSKPEVLAKPAAQAKPIALSKHAKSTKMETQPLAFAQTKTVAKAKSVPTNSQILAQKQATEKTTKEENIVETSTPQPKIKMLCE